jgi:acetyl esterase
MHGGGPIDGSPETDNFLCAAFARDVKPVRVSVKYRLAPAHKYPDAIDHRLEA